MKTFVSKSFLSVEWPFSERKYTQEGLLTDFVEQHSLLSFLFFFLILAWSLLLTTLQNQKLKKAR